MAADATPLLEVRDLKVSFNTEDGVVEAVDGVSFTLAQGEVLGIVGESGSGKSVTMMSVLRLINDPNAMFEGEVLYKGRSIMDLGDDRMREVRGGEIAMIFQDPMTSLNPVYTVGDQIVEAILTHQRHRQGRRPRPARSTCCARSASRRPSAAPTTSRTSSRAACASGR